MGLLGKIFGKQKEISEELLNEFYVKKEIIMESILGKQYEKVGHAIIPFSAGGAVDMYYFPNTVEGTAFATMELTEYKNKGPKPNRNGMYELLAFTKLKIDNNELFNKIERRMCGIFTSVGYYSFQAKLEPGETCEVPGYEGEENICLLFDEYKKDNVEFEIDGLKYGFLVCIEIFKSEMDYAMKNGSKELIKILKQNGFYPYSDMNRSPAV